MIHMISFPFGAYWPKSRRSMAVICETRVTKSTPASDMFLLLQNIRREPSIFPFTSVKHIVRRALYSFSHQFFFSSLPFLILFILCSFYSFIFIFYLSFEFNDSFIVFCARSVAFIVSSFRSHSSGKSFDINRPLFERIKTKKKKNASHE